jgi:hypothetical protein
MTRAPVLIGVLCLIVPGAPRAGQDDPARIDFYSDIRPIFTVQCARCHGPEVQKGGFRLDRRESAFKGGDSGEPAIVPGKPGKSALLSRLTSRDREERMPAKSEPLPAAQIALLRKWIDQGADWPDSVTHWAFQTLRAPAVPGVRNASWIRTPVDAFIAREHERRGIVPAPDAEKRVLLRRVTFDLTGLPPTPAEIDAFQADPAPDAYEKVVDRLLTSSAYGERWGRHWLDLVRFAETTGYEANSLRSAAWRYRDYVVRSLNADKPYDRFLLEQIAGDELEPLTDENLVATGFLASGRLDNNQEDRAVQRNDHLVDLTNATAAVVFGVQFGCAQCHDHKWDPITQADYYRFQGYFVRGQVMNLLVQDPEAWAAYEKSVPPEYEATKAYRRTLVEATRGRLLAEARKKLPEATRVACETPPDRRTPEQAELARKAEKDLEIRDDQVAKLAGEDDKRLLSELDRKIQALEKQLPEKPHAWGFLSPATGSPQIRTMPLKGMYPMAFESAKLKETRPRILKRGDPHQPGGEVSIGWPEVLGPTPPEAQTRSALVRRLTRPDHPLTARVFVNFVWARHFGRGLVATPGDFGLRGARPSHPELLDWLASQFATTGWSVKSLHRWIVCSSTYRESAAPAEAGLRRDPENVTRWRWTPRRLEAEAIRDAILAVSGGLDPTMGGPSVGDDGKSGRRTLYLLQKRHALPEVEELFDAPGAGESCPCRHVSTVSLQPLYLLNSPFVAARAAAFSARAGSPEAAFVLALGRPPSRAERESAGALDLGRLCHALFNLNEFVYLE